MPESQVFTHANFSGCMYLTGMEKPVPGSQIVGMARAKKKKDAQNLEKKKKEVVTPSLFCPYFSGCSPPTILNPGTGWNYFVMAQQ